MIEDHVVLNLLTAYFHHPVLPSFSPDPQLRQILACLRGKRMKYIPGGESIHPRRIKRHTYKEKLRKIRCSVYSPKNMKKLLCQLKKRWMLFLGEGMSYGGSGRRRQAGVQGGKEGRWTDTKEDKCSEGFWERFSTWANGLTPESSW